MKHTIIIVIIALLFPFMWPSFLLVYLVEKNNNKAVVAFITMILFTIQVAMFCFFMTFDWKSVF